MAPVVDGAVDPVREPVTGGYVDDGLRPPTPYVVEEIVRWVRDAAPLVAEALISNTSCPPELLERECGDDLLLPLAERAWRRPLTDDEQAWVMEFFETSRRSEGSFAGGLTSAIAAILASPDFLYLVETHPLAETEASFRLDRHEISNRLSFLLWDSPPDDFLRRAAEGDFTNPDVIRAVASQMMEDPKRRRGIIRFFREWLDVDGGLNEAAWDIQAFGPLLDPVRARAYETALANGADDDLVSLEVGWRAVQRTLKEELGREVLEVTDRLVEERATLADLLTTPLAYVGPTSRKLYGVPGPEKGAEGAFTTLDADTFPGLFTRAAVLAARNHLTEPSPVHRGVFVTERLLCDPPPSPPAGIPSLEAASDQQTWTTNRERYEVASSPPACAGCHAAFNPYGYVFEGFSAVGAPRALTDGQVADTQADLPGFGTVADPKELMGTLATSRQVHDCFVSEFFAFATYGTANSPVDQAVLQDLQQSFWDSGGDLTHLVMEFVTSDTFLVRTVTTEEGP